MWILNSTPNDVPDLRRRKKQVSDLQRMGDSRGEEGKKIKKRKESFQKICFMAQYDPFSSLISGQFSKLRLAHFRDTDGPYNSPFLQPMVGPTYGPFKVHVMGSLWASNVAIS